MHMFTHYLRHDRELDAESTNPDKAQFEKLVSGMYVGEVRCRAAEGSSFCQTGLEIHKMSPPYPQPLLHVGICV